MMMYVIIGIAVLVFCICSSLVAGGTYWYFFLSAPTTTKAASTTTTPTPATKKTQTQKDSEEDTTTKKATTTTTTSTVPPREKLKAPDCTYLSSRGVNWDIYKGAASVIASFGDNARSGSEQEKLCENAGYCWNPNTGGHWCFKPKSGQKHKFQRPAKCKYAEDKVVAWKDFMKDGNYQKVEAASPEVQKLICHGFNKCWDTNKNKCYEGDDPVYEDEDLYYEED